MKRYKDFVSDAQKDCAELMPWDLMALIDAGGDKVLLVDVRCPQEYAAMHIRGSLNISRGILEPAAEWGYDETEPELVRSRDNKKVVLICRSGNRSLLAAKTMQDMGYRDVVSLRTGLRGWNDAEYPLVNGAGQPVSLDAGDAFFNRPVPAEKLGPR